LRGIVQLLRPNPAKRTEPISRKDILTALSLKWGAQGARMGQFADTHAERFTTRTRRAVG